MSISIFSAPKPFTDPHIVTIQRNAIRSWISLGSQVEVILIGDETGIGNEAAQLGAVHIPSVERNDRNTPLISSVFIQAQTHASNSRLAYLNTDIILLDDFVPSVDKVAESHDEFLVLGQRWNLEVKSELTFDKEWKDKIRSRVNSDGSLHPIAGSDYFAFPRGQFDDLPPFALGRAGWDNWLIYKARNKSIPVVDATAAITVVHQQHDYRHLEGGLPHYRTEESRTNVQIGGGPATIFTLADATWKLNGNGLHKKPWPQGGYLRWAESALVSQFSSSRSLAAVHALLHPMSFAQSSALDVVRRIRQRSE